MNPTESTHGSPYEHLRSPGFDPNAYTNGVDFQSGSRLPQVRELMELRPQSGSFLPGPGLIDKFLWWVRFHALGDPLRLPIYSVDPENLAEAGWAVAFGPNVSNEVKEALDPLLRLRQEQAGERYRRIDLLPGWTSQDFRAKFELGFGPAEPDVMPYYLLLVGAPSDVSFELQYGLSLQYAVGRLDFEQPEDYAIYATRVKQTEEESSERKETVIFGVEGPKENERFLIESFVDPLTSELQSWLRESRLPPLHRASSQTKRELLGILQRAPGFLFAAGHGLKCSLEDPSILRRQGALVCSDHLFSGSVDESSLVTGDDLSSDLDLTGLIAFVFACYGAGCPEQDNFFNRPLGRPPKIAPGPIVSFLAKQMLRQGAQAFVGHVDRVWGASFSFHNRTGDSVKAFTSVCEKLLAGNRLGHSMEWIHQKYGEVAAELSNLLIDRSRTPSPPGLLSLMRKTMLDARNYVIIGDPAVRIVGANA